MEPRPSQPRTGETPREATAGDAAEPAADATPEAVSTFRPDYGPVARVPPTGDPINLRPAPTDVGPVPRPRRHSRGLLLAALAAMAVIALLLVATIATVAWLGSDDGEDDLEAVGAAPTATREAELALIADLQTQVAGAATPAPAPTRQDPPAAPTELPPTPTVAAAPTEAGEEAGVTTTTVAPTEPQAGGADVFGETTAVDLLPTEEDVPAGLVTTDEARLTTIDEVVTGFSDPEDAAVQLETWGWVENASRTFELPEGAEPPENNLTFLYISIHQFGSADAAQAALTYFADDLMASSGFEAAEVGDIGETARGLVSQIEGGEIGALYVQQGPFLLRIGTTASEGEALPAAIEATREILDRAAL